MLKWLVLFSNVGALFCVIIIFANERHMNEEEWIFSIVFTVAASSALLFGYIHSGRGGDTLIGLWVELQKKRIKKQLEDT